MTGPAILNSRIFAASTETRPADLDIVFASMRRCEAASHADGWLSCYAPVLDPAKLHRATNSRQCQHSSASPTDPRYGIHFDARSTTEVFKTAVAARAVEFVAHVSENYAQKLKRLSCRSHRGTCTVTAWWCA